MEENLKPERQCAKGNKKRYKGYDRPGRADSITKKYRKGKTHTGKNKTLRDKR